GSAFLTGKQIHAQALRTGIQDGHKSVVIETTLVDMYAKSGFRRGVEEARC
ncbi:unnamed protein product, partial [Musa acuminata subsp. burmannicoides]